MLSVIVHEQTIHTTTMSPYPRSQGGRELMAVYGAAERIGWYFARSHAEGKVNG